MNGINSSYLNQQIKLDNDKVYEASLSLPYSYQRQVIAVALARTGSLPLAINIARQSLKDFPNDYIALSFTAALYEVGGMERESKEILGKIKAIDPSNSRI